MRIGPNAIARHRDGISLNGTMPRVMHAVGLFDPLQVPAPGSTDLERVMARWAAFETGSGYLWLASPGNQRQVQVAAGRAHVRLHLQATAAGVQMHPLSQALQEFPEVRGAHVAVHRARGRVRGVCPPRRDADNAVRFFRPEQDDLIALHVGTTELGLYAHESYLQRFGQPLGFEVREAAIVAASTARPCRSGPS
jgi:hypothetical protein